MNLNIDYSKSFCLFGKSVKHSEIDALYKRYDNLRVVYARRFAESKDYRDYMNYVNADIFCKICYYWLLGDFVSMPKIDDYLIMFYERNKKIEKENENGK